MPRHAALLALLISVPCLAPAQELTRGNLEKVKEFILPSKAECRWQAIRWRPSLWQARLEAEAQDRPVLLWAMNGHPLGCTWNNGVIGRQSVWSNSKIQELASRFIPAADEVWRLQNLDDPECRYFRMFCEEGHYGGRPNSTRQGIYAATPSGRFLASVNTNDPDRMASMLGEALERWSRMPRSDRLAGTDLSKESADVVRHEARTPEGGVVLAVYCRDLPRESPGPRGSPGEGWESRASNRDNAWFTKEEALSILPRDVRKGVVHDWPEPLVRRFVRLHLVDCVRGQTDPYDDDHVLEAWVRTEVVSVARGVATVRFEGASRASTNGQWPLAGDPARSRGLGTRLIGDAKYDSRKEVWTSFELVASGTRWGGTQYNFRSDDLQPAGIAFAAVLAGDDEADRVAPAFHWLYP